MRCKEMREVLEEGSIEELSSPAHQHLADCSACQAYAQGWRLVRAGFRALAEEAAPEVSLGFAMRLVRRLEEATQPGGFAADFLEVVGKRVVLAGLLLTLTFLMALVLPSSGPLRGPATPDISLAQADVTRAENDAIFPEDSFGNRSAAQTVFPGRDHKQ